MIPGSVDQLRGDSDRVGIAPDTALDDHVGAELVGDGSPVVLPVPEVKRGLAADDAQFLESRQLVEQLFDDPVANILVFRVTAHVIERQHGNGEVVRFHLPFRQTENRERKSDGDADQENHPGDADGAVYHGVRPAAVEEYPLRRHLEKPSHEDGDRKAEGDQCQQYRERLLRYG